VKTISLKKVAVVAVASLGFGLLSVVPAKAAVGTTTALTATGLSLAATAAAPAVQGTAFTGTITATVGTTAMANGETLIGTFVLTDPTGTEVTDATFAIGTTVGATTTISAALAGFNTGKIVTATAGAGTIAVGAHALATFSFVPKMGGNYTLTGAITGTGTPAGGITNLAGTVNPAGGLFYTRGIAVTQGVTRGAAGTAKTANQAKVNAVFPAAAVVTYKALSSGVGAITGAASTGVTTTTISGVATDFSAGINSVSANDANAHSVELTLTATVAGTQTITVTTVDTATGLSSALYSIVVTWSAITEMSPGAAIVRIAPTTTAAIAQLATPATVNAYTSTLDAIPWVAGKAAGQRPATIQIILVNSDGTAATQGHKVEATVSGAGFVLTDNNGAAADGNVRSSSRTMTAGNENVAWVHISGDGTAGTGTISITVTDAVSGVKTSLPSKVVTFNDSVKKLEVTKTNFTIGKAGSTTGVAAAARVSASEIGDATQGATVTVTSGTSTTPAFVVTATDSGARATTTAIAPAITSSDANVVSGGTCVLDNGSNADYSALPSAGGTNSVGVYNCSFSAAANAASGGKATLTIAVADPSSTTGGKISTTLAVTIGGSISTETVTFDKTAYAPGEGMIITRTAKDSAGNPVADGSSAGAVTFNKAVGGTAPGASVYLGGVSASSTTLAKAKVFAPSIAGAITASMTGGDSAATVRTASSTVTDANAGLLTQIDALNAKIVALNALIAKIMKKLGVK